MSADKAQRARRETVVLTRQAVEDILVSPHMSSEPEDAAIFWRIARRDTSSPGIVAKLVRRDVERVLGKSSSRLSR